MDKLNPREYCPLCGNDGVTFEDMLSPGLESYQCDYCRSEYVIILKTVVVDWEVIDDRTAEVPSQCVNSYAQQQVAAYIVALDAESS